MSNDKRNDEFASISIDAGERITSPSRRTPSQPVVKSNNGLVTVLALVSLAAAGAAGYLYLELEKANQIIASNIERVSNLEDRLSATGEEMGSSTASLKVLVSENAEKSAANFEQIDKLWASAWRRNQKELKELQKEVTSVKTETEDSRTAIADANSSRQQLVGRIDALNNNLSELANNILANKVEQEALLQSQQQSGNQLRDVNEKVLLLERRNTSLLQQINELQQLVDELVKKTV